jgi:hypothetical protein
MPQELLWRMRCKGCNAPISLPRRSRTGTTESPQDQPTGTWSIKIVCRPHGHLREYDDQDALLEPVEVPEKGLAIDVLWYGVFECAQENCHRDFEVYASAEHFLSHNEIKLFLLNAKPPVTCPQGHPLSRQAIVKNLTPVKRLTDW